MKKMKLPTLAIVSMMLLLIISQVYACPSDGRECKDCILDRMNHGCPKCAPLLRCMARCLWGGASRASCVKKCDCNNGRKPKLSDCKKCMSSCRCSSKAILACWYFFFARGNPNTLARLIPGLVQGHRPHGARKRLTEVLADGWPFCG